MVISSDLMGILSFYFNDSRNKIRPRHSSMSARRSGVFHLLPQYMSLFLPGMFAGSQIHIALAPAPGVTIRNLACFPVLDS